MVKVGSVEIRFPVPANCDGYLRKIYGNYMELPDLEHLHIHAQNVTFYD
jgi:lipopolysaccharide cholinephosphotransferase